MSVFRYMICMAALILVSGCVAPDQYQVLEKRVAAIEASKQGGAGNVDELKQEVDSFTKSSRENTAEIKYEIKQIKERFQKMEGLIDEIQFKFGISDQAQQESLEKRLERLDNAISQNFERVIALEKYMGFEPTQAKAVNAGEGDKPIPVKLDTEQGAYDQAKKTFDKGDKEGARLLFENFINKYPESKNADNARFWIAESFYAEKWFEKAILEYQKVLETYPNSNKSAAARLKQGYAFAELGEKANARLILKELMKRHPDSNEAKYAAEKLKSIK